ncbi:short-chain dehydrogenase [Mycena epipterygia]|nr:short-chain dehydrogenase [Mycena epipterygia]
MLFTFWDFVWSQLFTRPKRVINADLTGKTVIVLGANTGIGYEAAKHFATMTPGRLILACRSECRGKAAVEKVKAATGYTRVELWIVDLANFSSVTQFADKFERDGGRLDILVENAGLATVTYRPTTDGWDSLLQVNCLSTSLLALLLLPSMIKTAQENSTSPRIVVVSSSNHHWVTIEKNIAEDPAILQTLGSAEYCSKPGALRARYPLTKLFNLFFVRALNARLPPTTPVIVNAVSPGYCYSELRREFTGGMTWRSWFMERLLAWTAEQGSRQLVWAALAHQDHPETLRGEFIEVSHVQEVSNFVLSEEGAKVEDRVWDDTVAILAKVDPRITTIVEKYLSPTA